MPDTVDTPAREPSAPDLSKFFAGQVYLPDYIGEPVDALKDILLARAGIEAAHPLRKALTHTRMGDPGGVKLPDTIKPLIDALQEKESAITVQHWLDAINQAVAETEKPVPAIETEKPVPAIETEKPVPAIESPVVSGTAPLTDAPVAIPEPMTNEPAASTPALAGR